MALHAEVVVFQVDFEIRLDQLAPHDPSHLVAVESTTGLATSIFAIDFFPRMPKGVPTATHGREDKGRRTRRQADVQSCSISVFRDTAGSFDKAAIKADTLGTTCTNPRVCGRAKPLTTMWSRRARNGAQ